MHRFLILGLAAASLTACDRAEEAQEGAYVEDEAAIEQEEQVALGTAPEDMGVTGAAAEVSQATRDFVNTAASSGAFEIQSAEAVLDRAQKEEVRQFAEKLKQDHEQANEALRRAAEAVSPDLDPEGTLTPEQSKMLDQLKKTEDAQLDAEFLRQQVSAHEKAIESLRSYTPPQPDAAPLKNWADETLPKLQEHLERAKELS